MAETLVLANVTVDTTGMVKNMAAGNDAVDESAATLTRFEKTGGIALDKIEERFLSLRHIAGAVLGGFTVAGAISSLKSFETAILNSTENFKFFSEQLDRAPSQLSKLIDSLIGLNDILAAASVYIEAIGNGIAKLGETKIGVMLRYMWGNTTAGEMIDVFKLGAKYLEATGQAPQSAFIGPLLPKGFDSNNIYDPTKKKPKGNLAPYGGQDVYGPKQPWMEPKVLEEYPKWLEDTTKHIDALTDSTANLNDKSGKMGETWDKLVKGLGPQLPKLTEYQKQLKGIAEQCDKVHFAFDAMTIAVQTMASILTNAFAGAGQSVRDALAGMMKSLAQMAFAYALWNVACAIMSSTGIGAIATQGTPHQFLMAAAAFGAVGVAAGLASRALGGGSESSAGGASALALAQPGGSRGAPTVIINVNGSLLGTSPQQLQRGIVDLWLLGARDMGGASAVVARGTTR
jgi:hypothetical protein